MRSEHPGCNFKWEVREYVIEEGNASVTMYMKEKVRSSMTGGHNDQGEQVIWLKKPQGGQIKWIRKWAVQKLEMIAEPARDQLYEKWKAMDRLTRRTLSGESNINYENSGQMFLNLQWSSILKTPK